MAEELSATPPPPAGGGKLKLILIIVGVLLLLAVGAIAFLLMGDDEAEGDRDDPPIALGAPPIYHSMEAFTVNFTNERRARVMQIRLDVMTRDPRVVEVIEQHKPLVRNNILLLLSRQSYDDVASAEGKEVLRGEILETIRDSLALYVNRERIEAVFFTSFVMQ